MTASRTPFAVTLEVGSSLANRTGSWRTERPVYVDRLPPCNAACPAGENIQAWLYRAQEGDHHGAWQVLMQDNPLPAVHGRVCYHPCEDSCNRDRLDAPVSIRAVERFLGDEALGHGWTVEPGPASGKRVLVVGAGPSGLSAAYHLRRLGHAVVIHEAGPLPGGMMRFGIPRYRLPREVLDGEIRRIEAMGVEIRLDSRVEDLPGMMREGGFDAAFVAAGAHLPKRVDIPAQTATRILDAVRVLRDMETGEPPGLARRVAVYGGGNTALDVARTAKRLGSEEAWIVYRRTRAQMPAHESEIGEALEEGVLLRLLSTIKRIDGTTLAVERMSLDGTGWPHPTGELETLDADAVILAVGQDADTGFMRAIPGVVVGKDGVVEVDGHMMTGHPGIFAGGDMVPAERTVTVAVGHGKRAARSIDAFLRGAAFAVPPEPDIATAETLNAWYYTDAERTAQPRLDMSRRRTTFEEVTGGLDADDALLEARRCLSCGNCFECDNCYGLCPDNAVVKLGGGARYRFDYDYCKGCALCALECPCGAIAMVPETI